MDTEHNVFKKCKQKGMEIKWLHQDLKSILFNIEYKNLKEKEV